MKLIKALGLAAVAALVAMAFIGVSAAAANTGNIVVCEEAELVCENPLVTEIQEGKPVVQIHGTAENPKLLSSIGTVECKESLANITVLNKLEELLLGHVTELSFSTETSKCFLKGTECTVTVNELGGLSFVHGVNPLEASATAVSLKLEVEKKEVLMNTSVTVKCGLFINCTYIGGEETKLTATSTESGKVKLVAEKTILKKAKGICPETSEWDAEYTANGTMWIES